MDDSTEESRTSRLAWRALWAVVPAIAVLPLLVARLPPLYDYYHWLFVGQLVAERFSTGPLHVVVEAAYALVPLPVPSLAAPTALGLLNAWLPAESACRVFAAAGVLLFGLAFARLCRVLQRRPTAVEFLGFAWALGYFLYKGYLSFFVTLPVAFLGLALLHDSTRGAEEPLSRRRVVAFSALTTAVYLGHVMAWGVLALGCVVYAFRLWRHRGLGPAFGLVATLGPSVVLLLVWVVFGIAAIQFEHRPSGAPRDHVPHLISFYESPSDKLRSLVQPALLFMRTDPLPPPFSIFWVNALLLSAITIVVWSGVDRSARRSRRRPEFVMAAALAALAIVVPLGGLSGMGRPDERLVLPAILIALAGLPARRRTLGQALAVGATVLTVLGLHAFEYGTASRSLEDIDAAVRTTIQPGAPVLSITVMPSAVGRGCAERGPVSIGTPALKWFGVVPLLATDARRVNLMGTTAIVRRPDPRGRQDLKVLVRNRAAIEGLNDRESPATGYQYLEIFGCPSDVESASREFAADFVVVSSGEYFGILRRSQ